MNYQKQSSSLFFTLFIVCFCMVLSSCNTSKPTSPEAAEALQSIIPKPTSVEATGETFILSEASGIFVEGGSEEVLLIGKYLSDRLKTATGFELPISVSESNGEQAKGNILLTLAGADASLGDEGYTLTITGKSIILAANKSAGLFRGIQTIRQLLPAKVELSSKQEGPWEIATAAIRDLPSYSYRGSMLDVGRHFFGVEDVKRYIDMISYYKMNVLHLHLSDDQGWRIEIKSWPNLTKHGGSTQVGGGKGGFYTQEQYKEIVAYAQSRYITVIPEIDMPGHTNAALASYGELNGGTIVPLEGRIELKKEDQILNGKSKPTELYTGIGVGFSTLRIEKEETFKFVNDVIRELAAITPGPYIHIGGDESHATKKEDYIEFVKRFREIVQANGKIMIGWEEIAQGDIGEDVIAQFWTSPKYGELAAEKGSKLIMSPSKKTYMDMQYDSTTRLGLHWAAYIEVDSAYSWDPTDYLNGVSKENILGIEAPLWTETIVTMNDIEYMIFPRLSGYAEIGWSSNEKKSWDEYKVRLANHGPRWKAMNIDYYKSKLVQWKE
ncbi:MAG TPA: beta-N-acetylhexosaminidase [Chryseolinea sp.]|nr:beta-N-acetylhexosaminidase [Chryseolinea sp.]